MSDEERRQERVLKNRVSAMKSLQKKKRYTDDLEKRAKLLSAQNIDLKTRIYALLSKLSQAGVHLPHYPDPRYAPTDALLQSLLAAHHGAAAGTHNMPPTHVAHHPQQQLAQYPVYGVPQQLSYPPPPAAAAAAAAAAPRAFVPPPPQQSLPQRDAPSPPPMDEEAAALIGDSFIELTDAPVLAMAPLEDGQVVGSFEGEAAVPPPST